MMDVVGVGIGLVGHGVVHTLIEPSLGYLGSSMRLRKMRDAPPLSDVFAIRHPWR